MFSDLNDRTVVTLLGACHNEQEHISYKHTGEPEEVSQILDRTGLLRSTDVVLSTAIKLAAICEEFKPLKYDGKSVDINSLSDHIVTMFSDLYQTAAGLPLNGYVIASTGDNTRCPCGRHVI